MNRLLRFSQDLDRVIAFKAIEPLNPKNKGKLTATEKKTGESAEELKHSKNPLTRKRANFAIVSKSWNHKGRRKSRAGALSARIDDEIQFRAHINTILSSWRSRAKDLIQKKLAKRSNELKGLKQPRKTIEPGKLSATLDDIINFSAAEHAGKTLAIASAHKGKLGLGAGFLLGRRFRKKKTDQGGMVPGDSPGSTSELSAKLDEILLGDRRDWWNNPSPFGRAMDIAANEDERERWLSIQRILSRPFRRVEPGDGEALSAKLDSILFEGSDPRPRNNLGEFSGNQEGAPDPNAMNIVYRQGQRRGLLEGGAAAVAGGAGGAIGGGAVKELFEKIKNFKGRK